MSKKKKPRRSTRRRSPTSPRRGPGPRRARSPRSSAWCPTSPAWRAARSCRRRSSSTTRPWPCPRRSSCRPSPANIPRRRDDFRYDPSDGDIELRPDFSTLCEVPWARDPTAQVIHDAVYPRRPAGRDRARARCSSASSTSIKEQGWKPVVAPELEFYLVKRNTRSRLSARAADRPLGPGRSGAALLFDLGGQRVRRRLRGHLRLRRGPGSWRSTP